MSLPNLILELPVSTVNELKHTMINYETSVSPFFIANKDYCENIENKLKAMNIDCSGFCSDYGYDLETTLMRSKLTYNLKLHKHQSTQNGVIIPVNAINYSGTELTVTGLNEKFNLSVGKSILRRLFTSKKFKDKIPSPYYISSKYLPENIPEDNLVKYILECKISELKLNNGILVCKIHEATAEPLNLITDFETIIKNLA